MTPQERQARVDKAQAKFDAAKAVVDSIDKRTDPEAHRKAVDIRVQFALGLNLALKVQERELREAAEYQRDMSTRVEMSQ